MQDATIWLGSPDFADICIRCGSADGLEPEGEGVGQGVGKVSLQPNVAVLAIALDGPATIDPPGQSPNAFTLRAGPVDAHQETELAILRLNPMGGRLNFYRSGWSLLSL